MKIIIADVPIEVKKKPIKNMHLYVKPPYGDVTISAPLHMKDEAIELFIHTKIGWIKSQQEKCNARSRQSKMEYVSGETIYVWGKQFFLQVHYSHKGNSLVLDGDNAMLTVRKESTVKQRGAYVHEWYRGLLKAEIEEKLPRWEKITGLYADSWQTKYMITRWGTCNTKTKKLWFNPQLAKKSPECLDYLILHELAHLKVINHNKQFAAILDSYMPSWREIKKKLNSDP